MRILVIPDIHGRTFWEEPCSHIDEFDKVVFLGDYHDPYPSQVSIEDSYLLLRDKLVPFVEANKDKVICLFGNHDSNYLYGPNSDRVDYQRQSEIIYLIQKLNTQMTYQVDGYLFSHSGVLPEWLEDNNLTLESLNELKVSNPALYQISPCRGGWDKVGSCIWGDVREYDASKHIPDLYQIFGHTQMILPIIKDDYACLDCKQAFVIDTNNKELKSYGSQSN